ncbi:MAG: lysostaphin resistance A-like protein [Kiloniellaceae bacterium]
MSQTPARPAPEMPSLPVRAGDLALILIVSFGTAQLLVPLLFNLIGQDGPEPDADPRWLLLLTATIVLVQTGVLLGMIGIVVMRKYGLGWTALGLCPAPARWYLQAALIAILTVPLVGLVNAAVTLPTGGAPFRNPQVYALAPGGFSWSGLVTMTVMAGVIAPFAEELAFRGLLYPWLRQRIGIVAAALVSAVCFAVLHGVPILIPALVVVGVILAAVYQLSGSLWPAMVTHGVFNALMTLGLYAALAAGIAPP